MKTYLLLITLLTVAVYSCTNKEAIAPDSGPQTGDCDSKQIPAAYVYGIIQSNCTRCHSGSTAPAGADFSTLEKFRNFINGNEAEFRLRVTSAQADMPPRGALGAGVRDSINCWISKGMPE
jgi:hypothetical protein